MHVALVSDIRQVLGVLNEIAMRAYGDNRTVEAIGRAMEELAPLVRPGGGE